MTDAPADPASNPPDRVTVGVLVAKRKLTGPWADHAWLPVGVLSAPAEAAPWTRLSADDNQELFYGGPFEIELHRGDTSHYRDNLVSGRPSLWIALRPLGADAHEVSTVTPDPYEGEALAGAIGEIIEAVPMPETVQAVVAAFVAAHHIERPFFKRKRDRQNSESLARNERGEHGPGARRRP